MTDTTLLQTELNFYNQHKPEYLPLYKGQFVLIKGQRLIGTFTTDAEAYKAGVEQFGNEPFLIKQVIADDTQVSFPALMVGAVHPHF